jgi:hypothetical protein
MRGLLQRAACSASYPCGSYNRSKTFCRKVDGCRHFSRQGRWSPKSASASEIDERLSLTRPASAASMVGSRAWPAAATTTPQALHLNVDRIIYASYRRERRLLHQNRAVWHTLVVKACKRPGLYGEDFRSQYSCCSPCIFPHAEQGQLVTAATSTNRFSHALSLLASLTFRSPGSV